MDRISKALKIAEGGQLQKAKRLLLQELVKDPTGDAAYNLAVIFHTEGFLDDARRMALNAIKTNPRHDLAATYLGRWLLTSGRLQELATLIDRIPHRFGELADLTVLRAAIMSDTGHHDLSMNLLRESLKISHEWPLYRALALAHLKLKQPHAILELLEGTSRSDREEESERLLLLAEANLKNGNLQQGTSYLRQQATLYLPKDSQTWNVLDPLHDVIAMVGPFYEDEETLDLARNVVKERFPEITQAFKSTNLTIDEAKFVWSHFIRFSGFYLGYLQPEGERELQENFSECIRLLYVQIGLKSYASPPKKNHSKKTIAIISEHIGLHVTKWLLPALEGLANDPSYRVLTISLGERNKASLSPNIEQINISTGDSIGAIIVAVNQISSMNLDLLIWTDVGMGVTSRHLACFRLAKCQWVHWGHPVTTGSDVIDAFITSQEMESPHASKFYSERLIRLPGTGAIHQLTSQSAYTFKDRPSNSAKNLITIQSSFKYLPQFDHLYIRVLQNDPTSTLTFISDDYDYSKDFLRRIQRKARQLGVNPDRLRSKSRMAHKEYLEFISNADLAIDSIGWSGGNTTIDCLLLGVPVITLPKTTMRSRHTMAILRIIKEEEMIAKSEEDFLDIIKKTPRRSPEHARRLIQKTLGALTENNAKVEIAVIDEIKKATPRSEVA